jgi:hypothetical protein
MVAPQNDERSSNLLSYKLYPLVPSQ